MHCMIKLGGSQLQPPCRPPSETLDVFRKQGPEPERAPRGVYYVVNKI